MRYLFSHLECYEARCAGIYQQLVAKDQSLTCWEITTNHLYTNRC